MTSIGGVVLHSVWVVGGAYGLAGPGGAVETWWLSFRCTASCSSKLLEKRGALLRMELFLHWLGRGILRIVTAFGKGGSGLLRFVIGELLGPFGVVLSILSTRDGVLLVSSKDLTLMRSSALSVSRVNDRRLSSL